MTFLLFVSYRLLIVRRGAFVENVKIKFLHVTRVLLNRSKRKLSCV